jgi:hypothetical protein
MREREFDSIQELVDYIETEAHRRIEEKQGAKNRLDADLSTPNLD